MGVGGQKEIEREYEVLIKEGWCRRFCPKLIAAVSVSVGGCVHAYEGWG